MQWYDDKDQQNELLFHPIPEIIRNINALTRTSRGQPDIEVEIVWINFGLIHQKTWMCEGSCRTGMIFCSRQLTPPSVVTLAEKLMECGVWVTMHQWDSLDLTVTSLV